MGLLRKDDYDLIVIGSGAGGGVGASYAASLGKKVAIFEKDQRAMGGECPNWACVPTKALLHSAQVYETVQTAAEYGILPGTVKVDYKKVKAWKDLVVSRTGAAQGEKVFTDDGIDVIRHRATFAGPREVVAGGRTYRAKRFIIATGSVTAIPPIPGLTKNGFITFEQAIDYTKLPKSLFVLGGGAIGCEFAQLFSSFGVKVHMAEFAPRLLMREEPEVGQLVQALFVNRGIDVRVGSQVVKVTMKGRQKVVHFKHGREVHTAAVDEILVATGKKPVLDLDLEKAGIKYDQHGIKINNHLQTSNSRVFVAGDVTGPYQFTHTASYQSHIAAHNAFSRKSLKPNYAAIPRSVFVVPEVASVGITVEMAEQQGIKTRIGASAISILGRANTANEFDGFVKVITDKKGVLIGAAIVGPRAGELIHELALAVQYKMTAAQVANVVHAFPTYSQAVQNACQDAIS
jgi:pyruvate/2-oxoglutarate dehydrogenase complex dihydrolipoamide dehydrogenase (E3) component